MCEVVRKKVKELQAQRGCVLLPWVLRLPWKKQTVLMEMLRAPDAPISLRFKQIITFLRSIILHNADRTTGFMLDAELPDFAGIQREFERLPQHCTHHVIMTLQVVTYDYPDEEVRRKAFEFYKDAVHAQHLNIETKEEYNIRLSDRAYDTYKPSKTKL